MQVSGKVAGRGLDVGVVRAQDPASQVRVSRRGCRLFVTQRDPVAAAVAVVGVRAGWWDLVVSEDEDAFEAATAPSTWEAAVAGMIGGSVG
jgi:hypothetical protein